MDFQSQLSQILHRIAGWFTRADETDLLIAALVLILVVVFRKPIAALVIKGLSSFLGRMSIDVPDQAKEQLRITTSMLLVTLAAFFAVEALDLPEVAVVFARRVVGSAAIIAFFSGWYNLCGPLISILSGDKRFDLKMETAWLVRVAQFGVVLFGITALLTVWEVDISGALTGVGVLGAGMAIATQDLIRNLVAGMNNLRERRFGVGDTVEIEGEFIGVVEQIDLRSTRLRGFDQIPRYIPNADLSNAVVMNYAQRTNIRVLQNIGFVLSCSEDQIHAICADLSKYMMTCGDFDTSDAAPKYVYIDGLTDSAIVVVFYARTTNGVWADYIEVNGRLTMKILELSRKYDAPLAYPTQTLDVEMRQPPDPTAGA